MPAVPAPVVKVFPCNGFASRFKRLSMQEAVNVMNLSSDSKLKIPRYTGGFFMQ